jgi:hypothetical protein
MYQATSSISSYLLQKDHVNMQSVYSESVLINFFYFFYILILDNDNLFVYKHLTSCHLQIITRMSMEQWGIVYDRDKFDRLIASRNKKNIHIQRDIMTIQMIYIYAETDISMVF